MEFYGFLLNGLYVIVISRREGCMALIAPKPEGARPRLRSINAMHPKCT